MCACPSPSPRGTDRHDGGGGRRLVLPALALWRRRRRCGGAAGRAPVAGRTVAAGAARRGAVPPFALAPAARGGGRSTKRFGWAECGRQWRRLWKRYRPADGRPHAPFPGTLRGGRGSRHFLAPPPPPRPWQSRVFIAGATVSGRSRRAPALPSVASPSPPGRRRRPRCARRRARLLPSWQPVSIERGSRCGEGLSRWLFAARSCVAVPSGSHSRRTVAMLTAL